MSDLVRLSKLMSQQGLCSRREADRLIEQGLVKVDGERVNTLGIKFPEGVNIELTQRAQAIQNERVTIMINKPVGYVSGQAEGDYIPAVRLITQESHSETDQTRRHLKPSHFKGLAPAGRLDIDSQGLLVLTQDGRIAKQLIGENTELEKEYLVRVDVDVTAEQIERLTIGLELDGKPLKRAKVKQLNSEQLQIILREGKKRQIRRMCEAVGLHVSGLKRVRVGELRLGKLEEGQWRFVLPEEFRHREARGPEQASSGSSEVVVNKNRVSARRPKPRNLKTKGKSLYGQGSRRAKKISD